MGMNSKNDKKNEQEPDNKVELDVRIVIQQLGISNYSLEQIITALEEKKG